MKRSFFGVLLFGMLAATTFAADARRMEVYPLYTSDAASVVSALQMVMGPDAKVIYDKGGVRLLVLAGDSDQQQAKDLLAKLNVPPVNVRVEIAIDESSEQQLSSIGISGGGDVVVTGDGVQASGSVQPRVEDRRKRRKQSNKQTLLLQSGTDAVLHVGQEVPYAEWLVHYGCSQGYAPKAIEMREVGALLRVQARVIGDGPLVSLKLTPELSGLTAEGAQTISFTRLSTDVTLQDGQTINLGGLNENAEFYDKFLVGLDRSGRRRALSISVTPHIEAPQGAPAPARAGAGVDTMP